METRVAIIGIIVEKEEAVESPLWAKIVSPTEARWHRNIPPTQLSVLGGFKVR